MAGGQNSTARYLDTLSDTDRRTTEDRISFLRALRDTNADVLKSLFEDLYPNYKQIWTQIEQCQTPTGLTAVKEKCEARWGPGVRFAQVQNDISRWGMVSAADADFRFYPEVASLKDDLVAWASKFHLLTPCPKQAMIRATWGSPEPDLVQIGERSGRGDSSGPETGENDNPPNRLIDFGEPPTGPLSSQAATEPSLVPAEWVLNVALETMKSWAEAGEWSRDWHYPNPWFIPLVGFNSPPPVQFEPWRPQWESRAAFRQRYMEECAKSVDQYLDVLENRAIQNGLEPERLPRKPRRARQSGIPENREFEWLVLWQTAGLSYSQIQERYRFPDSEGDSQLYDESSIRKAVSAAAGRVRITLRK